MMGMRSHLINNFYPFILLLLALTYTYPCFSSSSPSSSNSTTHACLPEQRDALLRYMHSYNDTAVEWDEHVDCCEWGGITCDETTGDVIDIDLIPARKNGTIENIVDILSPLYNLRYLSLSGTNLYGAIPPELSYFSKLTSLDLSSADQKLTMESHSLKLLIQNLTQLEELCLAGVKIYGDMSNSLENVTTALEALRFRTCNLEGIFPQSIFRLPNLRVLDLDSSSGLTVSLPIFNQTSPLEQLCLSSMNVSGESLDSIGNLKNLEFLELSPSHISSSVPSSIGNLTQLEILSLSSFEQEDVIPAFICRLSSLFELNLPGNKFCGMIPQCLGNLGKLQALDLSANQLTGSFPPSLANCTQLDILNVSNNMINDTITHLPEFFPNMFVIDLRENSFHGEIPLWICKSTPHYVDFSNNRLAGTIPPCLIHYAVDYRKFINLRANQLEGTIPDTFPAFCNITILDLSANRLKGPLPRSMVNCKNLTVIELGHNSVEDFFPNWLETLPELQILVLKFNKFHGEVNTLLNHPPFPNLRIFDISNNNFTGLLPTEYIARFDAMRDTQGFKWSSLYLVYEWDGNEQSYSTTITMKGSVYVLTKVLEALMLIDFSSNKFHGEIPKIIGDLIALKGLNLSHNNLTGDIPPSIQNMTNLEWLDLSSNKLTGQIPIGLVKLTELEDLKLSHNKLRGMIPEGQQFDTFGMESFTDNAGLCGSQIAHRCGKLNTPQLPPLPSIQEDEFDVFDWKIILMGYGCGLVIGFSVGYIVIELQKPKWFVSFFEETLLKKITKSRRRANRSCRT